MPIKPLYVALLLAAACLPVAPATAATPEPDRWQERVAHSEIIRDTWGIAHVYGRSDADAVFAMVYAQAEDDYHRIEHNYLTSLGRLAEAEGEAAIYSDLRQHLFIDHLDLKGLYAGSPAWLKELMEAWADGLNYYLATHPASQPRTIGRYEPWMALSFTEGSIGGDIEDAALDRLEQFYGGHPVARLAGAENARGGSNGFAIAPSRSASGHALLWINPHTSFYFRSELQMVSGQGLDVYGAVTWGQFFVYQGFNRYNGWMHTSYGGDAIDEYAETVVQQPDGPYYRYDGHLRKFAVDHVAVRYRSAGGIATRDFTVYHSHHGPIVRAEHDQWIAMRILQSPVAALEQSYLRTKTRNFAEFRHTQELRTDTSNNTVYADRDGTIAYFHGNFVPRRDPRFDFTRPVDGSNPATEWHGAHALADLVTIVNPPGGWLQNTNNWPFSAAGSDSPPRDAYPRYMWRTGENPRGVHAVQLLHAMHNVTLDSLISAGYDTRLPAFDVLLPPLLDAYDRLPAADARKQSLRAPLELLRAWDRRSGTDSVATAVAIFWGEALIGLDPQAALSFDEPVFSYLIDHVSDEQRLAALERALQTLQRDFGQWRTPWGMINRYQRLDDRIDPVFDDAQPSIAIPMPSSQWGALAAFEPQKPRRNRRLYGVSGNSFIAAVEFGPTVHAKVLSCGGESGDPASPHFADQAPLYASGRFHDALLTREEVLAHAASRYRPGEAAGR